MPKCPSSKSSNFGFECDKCSRPIEWNLIEERGDDCDCGGGWGRWVGEGGEVKYFYHFEIENLEKYHLSK